jgi:hypothetical protein
VAVVASAVIVAGLGVAGHFFPKIYFVHFCDFKIGPEMSIFWGFLMI